MAKLNTDYISQSNQPSVSGIKEFRPLLIINILRIRQIMLSLQKKQRHEDRTVQKHRQ
jgi:hypothetical protein